MHDIKFLRIKIAKERLFDCFYCIDQLIYQIFTKLPNRPPFFSIASQQCTDISRLLLNVLNGKTKI